jgi:hypothetical protein
MPAPAPSVRSVAAPDVWRSNKHERHYVDLHSSSHLRAAAILLVAGWVTFWAGAVNPAAWRFFTSASLLEFLSIVAAHQIAWLWIAGSFAAGVLLTLTGFVVLGTILRNAGDRVWSELGQAAYLFGSILWLASIAFRITATISAARETASSGVVPLWFEPLQVWSVELLAIYMVLAYLAIAAYGKALLTTGLAPRWMARTHLIFGLLGAVGFVARVPAFNPPLMIHLVPGILGVVLLVRLRGR